EDEDEDEDGDHVEDEALEVEADFTVEEYESFVSNLYDAAFNRDPDQQGLGHWVSQLAQNKLDLSDIAEAFMHSEEFADIYGHDLPDDEFIDALYHNVLGRESDEAGYNFWLGQLVSGIARYEVLEFFANSLENTGGETEGDVEITGVIDSGETIL
ncbi:MAG TPA: hypothetical protein DCF62_04820, partial [Porticoccaceae bacterium]|nr:hypothetical protein [Porticoccaceae bacterium]